MSFSRGTVKPVSVRAMRRGEAEEESQAEEKRRRGLGPYAWWEKSFKD